MRILTTLIFPDFDNVKVLTERFPIVRRGALVDFSARDQDDFRTAEGGRRVRVHGLFSIVEQQIARAPDGGLEQAVVLYKYNPTHLIEIGNET